MTPPGSLFPDFLIFIAAQNLPGSPEKKVIINKKQQKSTTSQPKIVLGLSVLTTRLKKEVSDVREKRAERKLFMKERYLDPENKLLNALFINHQHSGVYIYIYIYVIFIIQMCLFRLFRLFI